jgi:Polysaccharide deacetylase
MLGNTHSTILGPDQHRSSLTGISEGPLFRNDDVSWDTDLQEFQRFCAVFHKYGQTQIHGITLRGCTSAVHLYEGSESEYEGFDTVANLDNATIRQLSEGKSIEDRLDLINWLNASADDVALHGLYHTHYSSMSADEQRKDIAEGLKLMRKLFPTKQIRFFIAPFNQTNDATYKSAADHGLILVAAEGVHLEEEIDRLVVKPGQWYRYHHHRFYSSSRFNKFPLSIERLDLALHRNFGTVSNDNQSPLRNNA